MNKLLEKHGVSKEQGMNMLKNHYAGMDSWILFIFKVNNMSYRFSSNKDKQVNLSNR